MKSYLFLELVNIIQVTSTGVCTLIVKFIFELTLHFDFRADIDGEDTETNIS